MNEKQSTMLSLQQIVAAHPLPWIYYTTPTAQVRVRDAAGGDVQLFTMLDFVVIATEHMAVQQSARKEAQAH